MTLLSAAAQSASLDNDYGASAGANAPVSHEVALFNGDPLLGGTELTSDGGYAAVVVTNNGTNWPGAVDGSTTSALIPFATSTGAWSDTATHFVTRNASTGDLWDSGLLNDEVTVDAAGIDVSIQATIYYQQGV